MGFSILLISQHTESMCDGRSDEHTNVLAKLPDLSLAIHNMLLDCGGETSGARTRQDPAIIAARNIT